MEFSKFIQAAVNTMNRIAETTRNIGLLENALRIESHLTAESSNTPFEIDHEHETLTGYIMTLEEIHEAGKQLLKDLPEEIAYITKKENYFNRVSSEASGFMAFMKRYEMEDDPKYSAKKATCEEYSMKHDEAFNERRELENALERLPKLLATMKAVIDRHTQQTIIDEPDDLPFISAPTHTGKNYTQEFRDLVGNHAETLYKDAVDKLNCAEFDTLARLNYIRNSLKAVQFLDVVEDLPEVMDSKFESFFGWFEDAVEDVRQFCQLRNLFADTLHEVVG